MVSILLLSLFANTVLLLLFAIGVSRGRLWFQLGLDKKEFEKKQDKDELDGRGIGKKEQDKQKQDKEKQDKEEPDGRGLGKEEPDKGEREVGSISSSHSSLCFRITNIPHSWREDNLLRSLRNFDSSFDGWNTKRDEISLYPACYGSSKVALLNIQSSIDFLQRIGPSDEKIIETYQEDSGDRTELVIERRFYGLTPLNDPCGRIFAE
jgi:hypothetical protein